MTLAQLLAIMPAARRERAEAALPHLNAAMQKYGIDTPRRQAAFLAQVAHESGSLRYVRELADGMAYEGRADLGNTRHEAFAAAIAAGTSPGPYYKGRGYLQLTGYDNIACFSKAEFGDVETLTHNPQLLERPELAAKSAAWFWSSRKLNELADAGKFEAITRRINGGLNGYKDRLAHYGRALTTLEA